MKNAVKTMKMLFWSMLVQILMLNSAWTQNSTDLDDYILDKMNDHQLPGVAFAVIKDGTIALTKGYGFADVNKDIRYTPNTIQGVASLSKTVTATAIFKLWEEGMFDLDDPINDYLPFQITNPFYPDVQITFRMLLNHTSSVNEGFVLINGVLDQPYVSPGTAENLGSFLQNYFVPGGNLYLDSLSYHAAEPGTQHLYSNFGYTILGYLVETISGMPFNQYCNQNIFQPLCMTRTAWYYSELDTNVVSRPYMPGQHDPVAINLYECPDYPSRQLKSTAVDMARFLYMHLNYGISDGVRIIDSTTEVMMRTIQIENIQSGTFLHDNQPVIYQQDYCMGWIHTTEFSNNNKEYYGHNGRDRGVWTNIWISPVEKRGFILLTNAGFFLEQGFAEIDIYFKLQYEVADTLSTINDNAISCDWTFDPCEKDVNYWIVNSSKWPLNALPMKLGTKHYYHKQQLIDLFNMPVNGDASLVLAKELIAAKLNEARGSELSPAILATNSAMELIGDKHLPYNNPVAFTSTLGIQMLAQAAILNSYNAGTLNNYSCSNTDFEEAQQYAFIPNTNPIESLTWSESVTATNEISFVMPQEDRVLAQLYDVNGRLIKTLTNEFFDAGEHSIAWNTSNLVAGIYFIKLSADHQFITRRLLIVPE